MKTFTASILACLFLSGCASDEPSRERPMAGDPSGAHDETRGSNVTLDPVTGADVRTDSAWRTHWNGRWYFFESEESLGKFKSDPTAYVAEDGRRKETRRKLYPHDVR